MKKRHKLKLLTTLMVIGMMPLILSIMITSVFITLNNQKTLQDSVNLRLKAASQGLKAYYEEMIHEYGSLEDIPKDYKYVDSLSDQNIVMTVFNQDTRFITSVKNTDGTRAEGTQASKEIYDIVMNGDDYHQHGVEILGKEYYVYYTPLCDVDGNIIGMAFAGETEHIVIDEINHHMILTLLTSLGVAIPIAILILAIAIKLRKVINGAIELTNSIANGNLNSDTNVNSTIQEIDVLIEGSKTIQEKLRSVVNNVRTDSIQLNDSVDKINSDISVCNEATNDVSMAMDELAKGSMEMAESVQHTASVMGEMGENISMISELASSANIYSLDVKKESTEATKQLEDLLKANENTINISDEVVGGINESARAIDGINKAADMIAQIASQTSLLAL
ncbi:MAG: methyl-accepting chemotaxis protein, partial [Lachnospiraceae bacterium]|nr:methyl-accepting chemotaxis protein [Lachnospiraceae bacterium]